MGEMQACDTETSSQVCNLTVIRGLRDGGRQQDVLAVSWVVISTGPNIMDNSLLVD